jgi:hypothetical protein
MFFLLGSTIKKISRPIVVWRKNFLLELRQISAKFIYNFHAINVAILSSFVALLSPKLWILAPKWVQLLPIKDIFATKDYKMLYLQHVTGKNIRLQVLCEIFTCDEGTYVFLRSLHGSHFVESKRIEAEIEFLVLIKDENFNLSFG